MCGKSVGGTETAICTDCESKGIGHEIGLEAEEGIRLCEDTEGICEKGMLLCIGARMGIPGKYSVKIEDMAVVEMDGAYILGKACSPSLTEV